MSATNLVMQRFRLTITLQQMQPIYPNDHACTYLGAQLQAINNSLCQAHDTAL